MSTLVSPDDLFAAAKEQMLDGRAPESEKDRVLVMNFFAANIAKDLAEPACLLINKLYDELGLPEQYVREIVAFQTAAKS